MPKLVIQTVSLKNLVKLSSHRRKDAIIQHLAYRTFKAHAENVVRIHVLEIRSWVLVLFLDQMLSVVVVILSGYRIMLCEPLSVEIDVYILP